jgi:glycosyltransferase involved in cell wall biosynthesis
MQYPVNGLFVPAHVVPLYHPPSVVTIHDLGYLHWPEAHGTMQARMLDLTTRWSAKAARHIIVPSTQTANDLIDAYKVPERSITVVHHGIDPSMSLAPDATDATLRERYDLPERFVLAVGTVQPRKNLGTLAEAVAHVRRQHDVSLVIAGRKGWMYGQVERELQAAHLDDGLHMLDYVPSFDLPALYRAAELFAQPSRFEGFGMPILEAMTCGTPVVAARGSSLDEIGGAAAIRFDHDNPQELASAINVLLEDEGRRAKAIADGAAWSTRFTWEQAARKTRIVLEENLLG